MITQKFLDGVKEFQKFWADPVAVYLRDSTDESGNLDNVSVSPQELGFRLEVLSSPEIAQAIVSEGSGVVLLSLDDFRQSHLWTICREHGISCFYVSEYSLTTRKQIIQETTKNPLKRVRRGMWEGAQERKRKAAVAGANGLQCNGTPTYDCYRSVNNNALLYFDTRVTEDLLASEEDIQKRLKDFHSRPFQLFFSGRLARIKGAMHLVEVARELRRRSVDFRLRICGDGELKGEMLRNIEAEQLTQQVSLEGTLDFKTQLIPFVRSDVDLFVCCHPQGDPSCTYLETMSCGVPIAGYENEAFAGVARTSGSGWLTPLNNPAALAERIAQVKRTPEELLAMSLSALRFARSHTFEQTFSRRIEHLRRGVNESAALT